MKLALYALTVLTICNQAVGARFLGSVVYPQKINQIPEIKILYKGDEYAVEADSVPGCGHYQVIDAASTREFHVLVAESLQLPCGTGFDCFETAPQFPYKLYRATQTMVMQPDEKGNPQMLNSWHIQELDNKIQREIPVNTIVFLLPASFVTGLEAQSWKKDGQVAWLPRIVLDPSLSEEQLKEGLIKMLCTLMDFKPFHARFQQHVAQVANNCIVSMPTPRSSALS